MAWEARGNNSYYYRKRRIGRRVVSAYVGSSETAGLIARMDVLDQEQRWAQRMLDAVAREARAMDDTDVALLADLLATLTRAVLVTNGFHQHKRQWRRRRG
jgi:Tfp pilus assembly PilM family ATPase